MKYFPLKTALACLVIAPMLYLGILYSLDRYTDARYLHKIQDIAIGDTEKLLEGRATIEEQVTQNIHSFLKSDWMVHSAGLDVTVFVTTSTGRYLYPTFTDVDALLSNTRINHNYEQVAKQNFDLLNQGFDITVETDFGHGSFIANMILLSCFSLSLLVFVLFYRIGSVRAAKDTDRKKQLIDGLQQEEKNLKLILEGLEKERQGLFENIKSLNARYQEDKEKLKLNEEELFDEIVSLEEQLNSYVELKQQKEEEIKELKSTIQKYERRKSSKNRRNEFDFMLKRFSVLYKNIQMNRKAVSGLLNLNEDQQIKAEELVSLLNQNPDLVTVKRKVFSGKKHKTPCFEVLFAYNGRLYFTQGENNAIQVVIIGTKNTQVKDMEYLHSL